MLGLCFVLPSTLGLLPNTAPTVAMAFLWAQRDNPLLWVIDAAPLVLGLFGYALGKSQNRLSARNQGLHKQLHAKVAALKAANRNKDDFLHNLSHELRTPMNAILGMSELLLQSEKDRQNQEMIKIVLEAGNNLLFLINNILEFAQISQGEETEDPQLFRLQEDINAIAEEFQEKCRSKGLQLHVSLSPAIPALLMGAPQRVRQVLQNLLGNAYKFTYAGEIHLFVQRLDVGAGRIKLLFSIWDTGIGISAQQQVHLMQSFHQGDGSSTRAFGGLGLGLALSKRIVERQGGELWFVSSPGEGSVFYFTLVCQLPEAGPVPLPQLPERQGRILLVDDNELNRKLVRQMLAQSGARIKDAVDGQEAIACLQAEDFDLVLMDLNMPVLDGFSATRMIRSGLAQVRWPEIPIIALTAQAAPEDQENCRLAGMNDFLAKPLKKQSLLAHLQAYLPLSAAAEKGKG